MAYCFSRQLAQNGEGLPLFVHLQYFISFVNEKQDGVSNTPPMNNGSSGRVIPKDGLMDDSNVRIHNENEG